MVSFVCGFYFRFMFWLLFLFGYLKYLTVLIFSPKIKVNWSLRERTCIIMSIFVENSLKTTLSFITIFLGQFIIQ